MPLPPHLPMRPANRLARKKAKAHGRRGVKGWTHWWLFPPGLWEIGRRFVRREHAANRALSPPQNPTPLVNILFPQPVSELDNKLFPQPVPEPPEPYWIPVEKIIDYFGQSYTREQHHFVRYLESGFDDFKRYYRVHQPKTELQARFIDKTLPGLTGTGVWSAPWQPASAADKFSRVENNPVFFGPVSDLELAIEAARLDGVLHSIKNYGFLAGNASRPGGRIMGRIFLKDNGEFRIVIFNGRHRTAVLAYLGWDLIPVQNQPGSHPVRLSDLERWPGVVDGRFSRETARTMFEAFFRPRHQQLLPGW